MQALFDGSLLVNHHTHNATQARPRETPPSLSIHIGIRFYAYHDAKQTSSCARAMPCLPVSTTGEADRGRVAGKEGKSCPCLRTRLPCLWATFRGDFPPIAVLPAPPTGASRLARLASDPFLVDPESSLARGRRRVRCGFSRSVQPASCLLQLLQSLTRARKASCNPARDSVSCILADGGYLLRLQAAVLCMLKPRCRRARRLPS